MVYGWHTRTEAALVPLSWSNTRERDFCCWKWEVHLFRLSHCTHCYAVLIAPQVNNNPSDELSENTLQLNCALYKKQYSNSKIKHIKKLWIIFQSFSCGNWSSFKFSSFLSSLWSSLSERQAKASFSRSSFHFQSFVTQFYYNSTPPYIFSPCLFYNKSFFFPSSFTWLYDVLPFPIFPHLIKITQRLDTASGFLMSAKSSLLLQKNLWPSCRTLCFVASLSWYLPCKGLHWLSPLSVFWSYKATVGLNLVFFFVRGTS